jgi:hypothetical protein
LLADRELVVLWNPSWLLENCATSCDRVAKAMAGVTSFFDSSAMDVDGNLISFELFRGDVTVSTKRLGEIEETARTPHGQSQSSFLSVQATWAGTRGTR